MTIKLVVLCIGRRGRGRVGIARPLPKFWAVGKLSEIFFLVRKRASESAKFGLKTPILGKFRGKIEILSTHKVSLSENCIFLPRRVFEPTTPLVMFISAVFCYLAVFIICAWRFCCRFQLSSVPRSKICSKSKEKLGYIIVRSNA